MLIDWFTVGAQTLNFIVLLWLLKRVLYKPILDAIDAREARVAAELAGAAASQGVAEQAVEEFKRKNEEFDGARAALLQKATDEAKAAGVRLLEAARAAAEALRSTRRDALQREMQDSSLLLGRRAQREFFNLAKRVFKDLANGSLEEQMAALFCDRLRAMSSEDKEPWRGAMASSTEPVSIRSALSLPSHLQDKIQETINDTFQRQGALRFEIVPDLVSGVELTAQGHRVSWSIADYLAVLERAVLDETPQASRPTPQPAQVARPPAPAVAVIIAAT